MKSNKEIRKQARNTIRKNYFTLVFVCLIMMIVAGSYTTSFNGLKNLLREDAVIQSEVSDIESDLISGSNLDVTAEVLNLIFKTDKIEEVKFKESVTGGFFRTIFDGITHAEQFLFKIVKYIVDFFVTSKKTITLGIIILLIQFLYKIFIAKPLKVCQARVFMESRIYYKTPFKRMVDVIKKKMKHQPDISSRELSKSRKLGNDALRKWCSLYNYNKKKKGDKNEEVCRNNYEFFMYNNYCNYI